MSSHSTPLAFRTVSNLETALNSTSLTRHLSEWICWDAQGESAQASCNVRRQQRNATDWTVASVRIDYCLSEIVPGGCKLQFSVSMLVTVIAMNACKSITMLLTLYRGREVPLITVGDAVSSFLNKPDQTTKDRCTMAASDMNKGALR